MPRGSIKRSHFALSLLALVYLLAPRPAVAQGTAFTYQGRLTEAGSPATNIYDFQFKLFDSTDFVTGVQQGETQSSLAVQVTNGVFTVQLDFGSEVFSGAPRFLEVSVRPAGSPNAFSVLSPRQPLANTPYAVRSATAASADTATNAAQLGGLPSSGFIQNTTTVQTTTNFNISGDGTAGGTLTANSVNATTQYRIGGSRVLSVANTNNTFAGIEAGTANTTGSFNTFVGNSAGKANTAGCCNSFFGERSGLVNTTGNSNSFFGSGAGFANTTGSGNSFFGQGAGAANTTGLGNSFFGLQAGSHNTTGNQNSFFGGSAGFSNTTGAFNSFFGEQAGTNNTTGGSNSFFGWSAGHENSTGVNNSFFGRNAGLFNTTGTSNSFFGSSAGQDNTTGFTNSFFGSFSGASNTTGLGNSFFGAGAGNANTTGGSNSFFGNGAGNVNTTASFNSFFGATAGQLNTLGDNNSFFGYGAGRANTVGAGNSFFGLSAGQANTNGDSNSFFGSGAGGSNTTGSFNSFFGQQAGNNTTGCCNSFFGDMAGQANTTGTDNTFFGRKAGDSNTTGTENTIIGLIADVGSNNLTNATAIGSRAMVSQSNSLVLGSINGVNTATADTSVGIGTTAPRGGLEVARNWDGSFGALTLSGDRPTVRFNGGASSGNQQWILHEGSGPAGSLQFYNGGTTGTFTTPAITVLTNGRVGIGTTGPDQLLTVNGNASKTGGGSWAVFSDERLKTVRGSFTAGLSALMQLQPIRYEYRPDNPLGINAGGEQIGFVAQAVEKAIPEAVSKNAQGYLLVNNDPILWTMLNAIKEQQAQITRQQAVIDSLKKIICRDHRDAEACK
jgi:hypothetical protein